jgi:predicted MFS family arabinose efflux permease
LTALPGHRAATASAVINSGRQIASALGVAIFVTGLDATTHTGSGVAESIIGYQVAWVISAALALLSAVTSLLRTRKTRGRRSPAWRSAAWRPPLTARRAASSPSP